MALFIQQDENRSELQRRLNSELQTRAKTTQLMSDTDGVEDSEYMKGLKKTTSLAWAWVLIIIVAVAIVVWLIALSMANK